jgi:transcriptional regulator with XRE-family HTH domain
MKREFDIDAFFGALESKKSEQDISWRRLADQLEISDHTVFTRMSRGQVPPATTLLTLSGWLGVPLERFATGEVEAPDSRQDTLEAIHSYLRADKALAPESADAIASVLRAAYNQLAERREETPEARAAGV